MKKESLLNHKPLWWLFLKEYKNAIFMIALIAMFFSLIHGGFSIDGLSENGFRALIIFFLAITLWITNIIPLSITSLMIMGLLSTYKVLDSKEIYGFFGNSSLFFIIGAFIISAGIRISGLSKRFAYFVLSRYGRSTFNLLAAVFLLSAGLSHVMPANAVAALMFPILVEIRDVTDIPKNCNYGKKIFFAMIWGCMLGGVITYLGGARNPIAVGVLSEMTGKTIGFSTWAVTVAIPIYITGALVLLYFKYGTHRDRDIHIDLAKKLMSQRLKRLEKIKFREIKALFIFVITVFSWIFYNREIGISNIALISSALFFVLKVIDWEEANKEINWGVIFMYGGAIATGSALNKLGVLGWFANNYMTDLNLNPYILLILFGLVSIILTELVSNTAVIVILMPVAINTATIFNIDPLLVTYFVAVPSGLAFLLPVSSPVIAIAKSGGELSNMDLLKKGIIIKLVAYVIFSISLIGYWHFTGGFK